jgi:acetyl esterase/lipase
MNKFMIAGVLLLVACGSPSDQSDTVSVTGPDTGSVTGSTVPSSAASSSTTINTVADTVIDTTNSTSTSTSVPCDQIDPTITNHVFATYPNISDRFTSFDLYLPAGCGPFPVLVWVHGGAWVGGDKANPEAFDRAAYAFSLGYALASTNYRLANQFGKGTWPDYPNDVADAIAHIVDNADRLRLDAERISLLGHSAGGHTVAIVSADRSYMTNRGLNDDTIDCVIANDTEGYRLEDRETAYPLAIVNAFGTDPAVLADASPSTRIEREGAPSTRYLIVTRGSERRQAVASEFVDLVVAAGGDARLLVAGDYSHEDVNRVLGESGETILTPGVSEFLRECLTPSGR